MFLRIFELFQKHKMFGWGLFSILTILLLFGISRMTYKEDITDFLPLGAEDREAMAIYQDISGANQIIVIFDANDDPEETTNAIESFYAKVQENDSLGIADRFTTNFDIEKVAELADFVYENIPFFLTDEDASRIDSVLSDPSYVSNQLQADHEMLMFPSGGLLEDNISRDPLNLFTPIASRLSSSQQFSNFETYNGYIFSPDMKKAIVMVESPYGNSETENNSKMMAFLKKSLDDTLQDYPGINAHITGGPQIAVENAHQIKKDSILAVSISVIFILLLLIYSFRSARNISLIAVSILWGWVFALGGISLIHNSISIIVLGITSIIIGIAVNYPLHLIDHTKHEPKIKQAIKDIVSPLLIGNITTIGAFLALVPLKSVALRDLGIFASLLLLGTIIFVLIVLPHLVKVSQKNKPTALLSFLSNIKIENNRFVVAAVIMLTLIFSWFCMDTEFDSNMSNINFMTQQQREDINYFQGLLEKDSTDNQQTLYLVSSSPTIDQALELSAKRQQQVDSLKSLGVVSSSSRVSDFFPSEAEQQHRLEMWEGLMEKYASAVEQNIRKNAQSLGFSADAFDDFFGILNNDYSPQGFDYFAPIANTVFQNNFSADKEKHRFSVIDKVRIQPEALDDAKQLFSGSFDIESMNSAVANRLSDDFNYIGWTCSIIVFLFLWFSFGRIELAIISFIPMMVSWIWILGIMAIFGIKFNIVNIILATFIFGQGDDYTIFITEGCSHEFAYRKPVLSSFKSSIILSALIMFAGIGSLIVAKHPALFSLAEVTIIGMFSVVLMAYLIPPFLFNWLTRTNGQYRKRPLTLGVMARSAAYGFALCLLALCSLIIRAFCKVTRKSEMERICMLQRLAGKLQRAFLHHLPGIKVNVQGEEQLASPCLIACNEGSLFAQLELLALRPKTIFLSAQEVARKGALQFLYKELGAKTFTEDRLQELQEFVDNGYAIAAPAECLLPQQTDAHNLHFDGLKLAADLQLDVVPVSMAGLSTIFPDNQLACHSGTMTLLVGSRQSLENLGHLQASIATVLKDFNSQANSSVSSRKDIIQIVKERYLFKDSSIYSKVCKTLNSYPLSEIDAMPDDATINLNADCYGAVALYAALSKPKAHIIAVEEDENARLLAANCADGLAPNLTFVASLL